LNVFESSGRSHYDGFTSSTDYFQDQILSAMDVYSKNQFSSGWQSLFRVGLGSDHLNDYSPAKNVFNTDQNQFTWQNDIAMGSGLMILGVEDLEQKLESTKAYTVKSRTTQSFFAGYRGQAGSHSYQLNLRNDDNSQFGEHSTGFLGYGFQISPRWRAGASVSTSFKSPTFNNLYYPGSGDPNLRPEKARNKELSLHYDMGLHHVSAVYFNNQVTDLIGYMPVAPYAVTQTQAASLTGATFSYNGLLSGYLLRASLDLQDPVDQSNNLLLIRRARQHATLGASKQVGAWNLGGEWLASSYRYDDNANTKYMAGYGLFNLTASRPLGGDWSVLGRINNLFDKQYELVQGYNTPGINLFISLRYQPAK
jgi:vitamin B12 transporter